MKKSPSRKLTPTVDRPDLFKHAKSLVRRKKKMKLIKAWAVVQEYLGQHMRSHILSEKGLPLIYIQPTKPRIFLLGVEQKVIAIKIIYTI